MGTSPRCLVLKASIFKPSFASNREVSYIYFLMIVEKLHPSQASREKQLSFLDSKALGPRISVLDKGWFSSVFA